MTTLAMEALTRVPLRLSGSKFVTICFYDEVFAFIIVATKRSHESLVLFREIVYFWKSGETRAFFCNAFAELDVLSSFCTTSRANVPTLSCGTRI